MDGLIAPVIRKPRAPIVISMTTHAARNGSLGPTLASLANQTIKPDKIIVYGAPGSYFRPLNTIPPTIEYVACGVDLGPVMKISAAVLVDLPPHAIVITVDDDITYEREWLAAILVGCAEYPESAIGFSGWNTQKLITEGLYDWANGPGEIDVLEGWAGVAYRAGFLNPSILKIPEEFKFVDDVWISSWLHKRKIQRRIIGTPMCKPNGLLPGLHDRSDFRDLNRHAAQIGFPAKG